MENKVSPKVSIGMPVYNGAEFLSSSIESILNQTFSDFELIISDNASTDATEEICRNFARHDNRIRYFRNEENIGASDNYNAVYFHASTPYFKWTSCSDLCHPQFIEKCVDVLDEYPDVVLCYPEIKMFNETIEDAELFEDDLHLMMDSACERYAEFNSRATLNNVMNGVLRTSSLRNTAMIKPFFSSDTALMAELVMRGKFYQVKDTYYYRRMDEKTATALKDDKDVLKHYFPDMNKLMLFQNWKLYYEHFSAIRRAPVSGKEKQCIRRVFYRMLRWHRKQLLDDVGLAFKKYAHKITQKFS